MRRRGGREPSYIVRVEEVGGDYNIYYEYASVNKYTSLSVGTFRFPRHVPHKSCEIGHSNIKKRLFGPHACRRWLS